MSESLKKNFKSEILIPLLTVLFLVLALVIGLTLSRKPQELRRSAQVACNTCYNFNASSDGLIDIQDILFVANIWGATSGSSNYNSIYDVFCSSSSPPDGTINISDIQTVANKWGTSSCIPSTTQPTPTPTTGTGNPSFNPFGTVTLTASDIEFNVNGAGSNIDSIAFWEASDPTQSLMFVTSKGNSSVEVYKYPFTSQLKTITSCGSTTNGVWVDQERDILYITKRSTSDVCAYNLPGLGTNSSLSFTTVATSGKAEPNLTLLKLTNGQRRIYVSYDYKVYYHDAVSGNALGMFTPAKGLETMYADNYYQRIYIPDENGRSGVYMYDPSGNPVGSKFGSSSIFDSDAEGIWVYSCPSSGVGDNGEGLIVVSDQKSSLTDFEVFNRKTKEYLGKINIRGATSSEDVNNTDGISITQQSSTAYPMGLLAVIDDDTSTVGVGWDTILSKTSMSCGN